MFRIKCVILLHNPDFVLKKYLETKMCTSKTWVKHLDFYHTALLRNLGFDLLKNNVNGFYDNFNLTKQERDVRRVVGARSAQTG